MYVRKQSLTAILGVTAALSMSSALAAATTTWFTESASAFENGDGSWNSSATAGTSAISPTNTEAIALFTPTANSAGETKVTFNATFPYPNDETDFGTTLTGAQTAFRLTTADSGYKFQVWAGTTPAWTDVTLSGLTPTIGTAYTVTLTFTYGTTSTFTVAVKSGDTTYTNTDTYTCAATKTAVAAVGFIGEGTLTSIAGTDSAVAIAGNTRSTTVSGADATTTKAIEEAISGGGTVTYTVTDSTGSAVSGTSGVNTDYSTLDTGTYTLKANITPASGSASEANVVTVGVIKEPAQENALIAVPFNGLNGSAVTVATLFSNTSGLSADDTLSVYKGNQYYNYTWNGTAWEGQSGAATTMELTAGTGAILTRKSPTGTVSIVGTTTTAEAQTVNTGTVGIGANTGTADKKVSDLAVSATTTTANPVRIYKIDSTTGKNVQYAKGSNGWVKQASKTVTVDDEEVTIYYDGTVNESDTIPAGQGFWIDNSSGSNTTVK